MRSDSDGTFLLRATEPDVYKITVMMRGFAPYVVPGLLLEGRDMTLLVKLRIEEDLATVTVNGGEAQVMVDPGSNGSAFSLQGSQLNALADDPDELANQLNVLAGNRIGTNGQIYVDGFSNGQLPNKAAIREIRLNENPFSAQYDRTGEGRVEILTKPGTDKLHGSASMQGMDKAFNTLSPFLQGGSQPDYHQILSFASITGPIRKDASFNLSGNYRTVQSNSIFSGTVASGDLASGTLCQPGVGTGACSAYPLPPNARATATPQTRFDINPRVDIASHDRNTLTIRFDRSGTDAHNSGIGGLNLSSIGYDRTVRTSDLQLSDTQNLSPHVVNDTRFDFARVRMSQSPISTAPTLNVIGSFVAGGSSAGVQSSTSDHLEVQDYASIDAHAHFIRAGIRVRSDRQAQYSNANANSTFSYRTIADYLNNNPFQYTLTSYRNARVNGRVTDVGVYGEDDWKARSNLVVSYGLRYEGQGGISSNHDFAPRLSVNYGIPRKKGAPLTTLRFGYGIFYERFGIVPIITTILQNGYNSAQRISRAVGAGVLAGCSPTSVALCGSGTTSAQTVYGRPESLRTAYQSQFGFSLDQELPRHSVVSLTLTRRRGIHQYFSRSLPTGGSNLRYEFQSGGYSRHTQLFISARSQVTPRFSVSGIAQVNFIRSNTNGLNTFQTDSLHPAVDYGRPTYWNRAWTNVTGDWRAPFGFTISPILWASTGDPYSITTGVDTNGDSIINDRAAFAPGVSTHANCLDPGNFVAPPSGTVNYARTPMGYCIGPAAVGVNARIVRDFHFGPRTQVGGGAASRRYTASVGTQVFNLFNDVNYDAQNGDLSAVSSGLFGKSQTIQGASDSSVRRVFLQVNVSF